MKLADVEEIYSKNKELHKDDIRTLQEWAEKQPHLPTLTELELQLFLHSCYYHIELAKATIDNFCTYRAHSPEFNANLDLTRPELKTVVDIHLLIDLPKCTPEGYKIIFVKLLNMDPSIYSFSDHVKLFDMIMMQSLHRDGPSDGLVIILDMVGFNFNYLMKIQVLTMKKILMYLQEALPVRLKGIFLLNVGSVMDALMALIKPFLNKEVAECFHVYESNYEKIFDLIPKDCFPEEFGGTQESIATLTDMMKKRLHEAQPFLLETEKLIADESKRPGKPKNFVDVYGVEGSFKKLDID